MQPFAYASPTILKEVFPLLAERWGEADILAGGTDLLSLMKDNIHTPQRVINIKAIKELGGIRTTPEGLRIGALVTFDELLGNAAVRHDYPALITAAQGVASPQVRNLGTVGGDLCQRPHCWYFRGGFGLLAQDQSDNALVPQGENKYHAILGNQGPAYFVSASSLGPPLIALGAKIRIASAAGNRVVDAADFFVTPQTGDAREIALKPNEIVTEILVPLTHSPHNATCEIREKQSLDSPLATASVALGRKGDVVASARVVLGHVAPVPWIADKANQFLAGKTMTEDTAIEAASTALAGATPLSQNAYKVQLARVAVKRALLEAWRKG